MAYILRSNSLPNLYSAKGAGVWAFKPRKTEASDKGLKTIISERLKPGTQVVGMLSGNNGGALMFGTVRSYVQNKKTINTIWPGVYNFPINIDWEFINKDQSLVNKTKFKNIVGALNGFGHLGMMEISQEEFENIIKD